MKKRILLIAVLILFGPLLFAQDKTPERNIRIGILGAGAYNMHSGQFSTYDGMLICGSFEDGSGLGWIGGNSIEFPLGSSLSVFGRAFFHKADGNFDSFPENPPRVSLEDGSLVSLATEDNLDVSLDYLQFEVLGSYFFTDKIYVALGPGFAFSTHASYSQTEDILQPMGINFQNGERSRQIASANFDDNPQTETNLRFSVHCLIGADFPVTDNIFISPEAGYIFPFTNVLNDNDWKVSSLHAGIALKFELGTPEKVIIKEPAPEPAPDIAPAPVASLQAKNLLEDGTMLEFGQITVIEESKNDVMPLLPYIFFEAGESGMPPRYKIISKSATEDFDETSLRDSIIGVYHNLLNIVGKRMQIHDNAGLTVTGCVEPLEDGDNLKKLAAARAVTVKNYLVNTWGISPDRINTVSRELPDEVSNRNVDDGREENRRVELISDDPRVLAPVRITMKNSNITPKAIVLKPEIEYSENVKSWQLEALDIYRTEIWAESGEGIPPATIPWNYDRDRIINLARTEIPGNYISSRLKVQGVNNSSEANAAIPIFYEKKSTLYSGVIIEDSVLERYNLIFFDFDKPEINEANERAFRTIHQRINTNSSVSITGFTDRLGPEEYNRDLSEKRAQAVEDAIKKRVVPDNIYSRGVGEMLIYNNNLPEGRFYNRTVIVEITTPIKD